MSATRSALLRRLPIPSCDDLMTAVANGQPACDAVAARFAPWALADAVPQIVMNALDPLLVETVLGPVHSRRWLPLLREHYRQVKQSYPGDFADVEVSWRQQRAWWMQFTEPAEEAASSAGGKGSLDRAEPVAAEPAPRRSSRAPDPDRSPKRSSAAIGPASVAGVLIRLRPRLIRFRIPRWQVRRIRPPLWTTSLLRRLARRRRPRLRHARPGGRPVAGGRSRAPACVGSAGRSGPG